MKRPIASHPQDYPFLEIYAFSSAKNPFANPSPPTTHSQASHSHTSHQPSNISATKVSAQSPPLPSPHPQQPSLRYGVQVPSVATAQPPTAQQPPLRYATQVPPITTSQPAATYPQPPSPRTVPTPQSNQTQTYPQPPSPRYVPTPEPNQTQTTAITVPGALEPSPSTQRQSNLPIQANSQYFALCEDPSKRTIGGLGERAMQVTVRLSFFTL